MRETTEEIKDSSVISYHKVLVEDNRRIMWDSVRIAHGKDIEVFQSENRNVITILHGGFYYHVVLEDIVNAVLMDKLETDLQAKELEAK